MKCQLDIDLMIVIDDKLMSSLIFRFLILCCCFVSSGPQMVRTGLHAEELLAVTRGSSGEGARTAAQQWSAVEQQKVQQGPAIGRSGGRNLLEEAVGRLTQLLELVAQVLVDSFC